VVTVAITTWLSIRMARARNAAIGMVAALGGYLIFAPYVLPWYPACVIPSIGLVPRTRVARPTFRGRR
jgi:hypothetical protein